MGIFDRFKKKKENKNEAPPPKIEPNKPEKPITPNKPEPKAVDTEIHKKEWNVGDKLLDRYEIQRVLKGGMGVVYIALDHKWNQMFAIKTFQDKYLMDKDSVDRFISEANIWVDIEKHKNIVQAYYVQSIEYRPYIFLEYVAGDEYYGADLSGWITRRGLDLTSALRFAIQFCDGMIHAEEKFKEMGKPFVHRDIKPQNIMVTKDKVVKVTDFGLVKNTIVSKGEVDLGRGWGTPPYMSPEQWLDLEDIDIRSDIYAFGCVLYEMLTGQPPFVCPDAFEYKAHHLKVTPRQPKELVSDIPEELNFLVMKCLEKESNNRYTNFWRVREELSKMYYSITRDVIKKENSQRLGAREAIPLDKILNRDFDIDKLAREIEVEASELALKGTSLYELGRHQEAITCYDKALKIMPNCADTWSNKGIALTEICRYQEAIECCNKALELDPDHDSAWLHKGNVFSELQRYQEAIECYDNATQIIPNDTIAWNNKGLALIKLQMYHKAIECCEKALEIDSRNALAWVNKGSALLRWYKVLYKKSLEAKPFYEGLGPKILQPLLYEVLKCCDNALEIHSKYIEAWYNKGVALVDLRKYREAIECFDSALEINPVFKNAIEGRKIVLNLLHEK